MNENTKHFADALRGLEPTEAARARGMEAAMDAFDAAFAAENADAAQGSADGLRPMVETPGQSGVRDFGTTAMSRIRDFFTITPRNAMMGGSCAAALIAALLVFRTDPGLYDIERGMDEVSITDVEAPAEPLVDVTDAPDAVSEVPTEPVAGTDTPVRVPAPAPLPAPVTAPEPAPVVDMPESYPPDATADADVDASDVPPPPTMERLASGDASDAGLLGKSGSDAARHDRAGGSAASLAEPEAIVVTGSRSDVAEEGFYLSRSRSAELESGSFTASRSAVPMSATTGAASDTSRMSRELSTMPTPMPVPEPEIRRVLKTPARTVERVIPAVTETVTRRIDNGDGTFDTVTETVVVQEARVELVEMPAVYEDIIMRPDPLPRPQPEPQSGQLTAGDYDDVLNPDLYRLYADRMLQGQLRGKDLPYIDADRRIMVRVEDRMGRPVPLAKVSVRGPGGDMSLVTGADGRAWLYPGHDGLEAGTTVEARVGSRRTDRRISREMIRMGGEVTLELGTRADAIERMDLLLTIDATGSMADEMRYLQTELQAILARVEAAHPGIDIRTGLVVYRDVGDNYVVREVPFTDDMAAFQRQLMAQSAGGGGDMPEAMHTALNTGLAMDWRDDALKVNLLVADAPPHDRHIDETWKAAGTSRERGIHMVPLAASGVDKTAEFVMRAMAQVTAGRFLFLTDDSGIGNPHAEPTVDCYVVTRLDGLVTRVLNSLISGERAEPRPGEVIRSVGNYDAGVCDVSDAVVRTVNQRER